MVNGNDCRFMQLQNKQLSVLLYCECLTVSHSSEFSPVTSNQAAELGQTLNENVIKPTQEKVTLMFEVVDLVVG